MPSIRISLFTAAAIFSASIVFAAPTPEERREAIEAMNEQQTSSEQTQRKERSEAILRRENVPFISHLPVIESSSEATIQRENDVEMRALCLVVVAVKGEGLEQEIVESLVAEYDLEEYLTPKEIAFINNPEPTQHEKIQFVWRYESAWVMFWALGFIESLPRPEQIADVPKLISIVQEHSTESFQQAAKLRTSDEILDHADLIYRYHWAVRDARINGKETPADLDGSVVYERHYSLNWLIGYMGQDWDDISTDT